MPVKHNGAQVVAAIKRVENNTRSAPRDMVKIAGVIVRDAIRSQIPPGGINSAWDGYAAKGNLQRNVVASAEPEKTATGYKTTIYVPRYNIKHWLVHEDGAIIFPKSGRFLVFPKPPGSARYTTVPGRKTFQFTDNATGLTMIATEYVIIRPKRYWSKGVVEGILLARAAIPKQISLIFSGYGVPK